MIFDLFYNQCWQMIDQDELSPAAKKAPPMIDYVLFEYCQNIAS
jgi:hypothetical protein